MGQLCLKNKFMEKKIRFVVTWGEGWGLVWLDCLVTQLCPLLCDPVDCSTPGLHCPSLSPGVCSNSCPLNWWCCLTISSSAPFSFSPQSFPASGSFPMSQLFASGGQSWNFSISPSSEYSGLISFRMKLVSSPCCPRDSQESSPAPQSESINSLALSLLYGPALTFVRDYCKNHSFDYTDLCQQSWLNE